MAGAAPSVLRDLRDKHPNDSPPSIPENHTPALQVSPTQVSTALSSFSPAAGPGPSGERPSHLQAAIQCANSAGAEHALHSTTMIINTLLAGKAPEGCAEWIAGARLFAIKKKSQGIRPIASGDVTRRLVAKVCCTHMQGQAKHVFQPFQFGVGIPGGAEAIVHSVRALSEADPGPAVLTIDFRNAFNEVMHPHVALSGTDGTNNPTMGGVVLWPPI